MNSSLKLIIPKCLNKIGIRLDQTELYNSLFSIKLLKNVMSTRVGSKISSKMQCGKSILSPNQE